MFVILTSKELYRHFLAELQSIYTPDEAAVVTERVFENITGMEYTELIRYPSTLLTPIKVVKLNEILIQLLGHKPLQYALGEAWFYHLKFKVNEQVLIPRPETEELVESLLADHGSASPGISILDIGTGSGCIPISIKKNRPHAILTAIDISKTALELAEENALIHNAQVVFKQLDFLDESVWLDLPVFDIIISNPPYIPIHEKNKLARNVVAFEPHLALFVPDKDPLLFYEKIANFSKTHLSGGGKIYLETHQDLAKDVATVFKHLFSDVVVKKDLSGKERMVIVVT